MRWIIVILLCTCTFCTQKTGKEYVHYTTFPEERSLHAQAILLDTALLRYPFRITILDSVALVLDIHNTNNYFHAFTYPGFDHLVSFGKRGEAPEEILSAENIRFVSLDSIWAVDASRMQLSRWSISPTKRAAQREEIISINKQIIQALEIACLTDSSFIIPDYTGTNRLCFINRQGEINKKVSYIPSEVNFSELNLPALAQAWRSFIDYNPTNNILAVATQLGEVLEIYNLKDSTHSVIYGPSGEPEFQIRQGAGIPTGIMGFSDIQVTDRFIYAVFHGRTFKEIAKQEQGRTDGGKYIYVFSLTGKPVRKYILDRYIYGIDVNEEKGIITAVEVNSDQPIIEFSM